MEKKYSDLKVAIIHDWLPLIGGAEMVLEQITKIFPNADIYTLFDFLSPEQKKMFGDCNIIPSYLNKLPFVKKYYRKLLPLMPQAIESFDLYEYDLVLSSSHNTAKGVLTHANQHHISYVHSPARYAWDLMHQYLRNSNSDKGIKGYLTQYFLNRFRIWDYRTANGVDHFIANSKYISKRIYKVYRRESDVIYPPVNISEFSLCDEKDDFYLTVSRMVPYKNIDKIVSAFTKMKDKKLVVIGDGPEMNKIKNISSGNSNITLMGHQRFSVLKEKMQKAKAFIFAAEEDFGIVPLEAQACGTPVIAYGAGGALETVVDFSMDEKSATGIFFDKQTSDSIMGAVERFEAISKGIIPENCRKNAELFSEHNFRENITNFVDNVIKSS